MRIEEERRRVDEAFKARQIAEEKKRIEQQKADFRQRGLCQHCGGAFKGMFKKNGEPLTPEIISFDNLRSSMVTPEDVSVMFASKDSVRHSILTYAESGRATESDMDIYRTAYSFLRDEDKVSLDKIGGVPETIENSKKIKKTSISRLEQYFKCPYSYYLKYSLGLQKRKEGEMESFDAGTILHAIFENFFIKFNITVCKVSIDSFKASVI